MKTVINVKTDKDVKEKAQRLARELGLPLSTVVNAYLREFITKREIRLALEPQLRPEVEQLLVKASQDYKKGRNISGPFTTAEEIENHLASL
ncbi:MAG: DUF6364 family protein [bacterium]|nr:DUF6364 family protein [bacterium]